MAFIRNCLLIIVFTCCMLRAGAQAIYYPSHSSQMLKSTAGDLAMLLQRAIPSSQFTVQEYAAMPSTGIILVYDSTINSNQSCKVESDGITFIKFSAAQDNGLHFGIYQYLHQAGFRFYLPGSIWEIIPVLSSPYKMISTTFSCNFKYKNWSISGGCNRWAMDNNTNYSWDTYFGENGHNWALYQRRNGMAGEYHFAGHRGDLMNGTYLSVLQNNPCYVACYNGSRNTNAQSVPDIHNNSAMQLWSNTIEQKYTLDKNIIYGNTALYANYYRNFDYYSKLIGIEVPDGANWGNSKDNNTCSSIDYPKESDQNFMLANNTAERINATYPDKHFQVYAYATHSDVPSTSILINKNIDIQVIPEVYQLETSTNGMRNRWYNRSANVSEYHYLNLSDWTGETPWYNWSDLKTTLEIARIKKSQGLMWETSPAKFGTLPYLLAANNNLNEGISIDSTLHEFCDAMFAGANNTIFNLLQLWGDKESAPDRYKMQLYLQLIQTAMQQTNGADANVKNRIRELKAYLHYMVLYFDLAKDDQHKISREAKDAALCIYLAKISKMQLVNSYYLVAIIANRYHVTSSFYLQYNNANGSAYLNGNLPLLSAGEIDNVFLQDINNYSNHVEQFNLLSAAACKSSFSSAGITPTAKINAKILYTNGMNYYNKTAFNFIAPAAGSISIHYTPHFYMTGKGNINFLVESADRTLEILKDFTIDNSSTDGTLTVNIPAAGNYILFVTSKYQSAVDITITTNGNYFYKQGAFLGNSTENYRTDTTSFPGIFYIPAGLKKVYFFVNNSISSGKYASAETIGKSFNIKDNKGMLVTPRFVTPKDSSLFYLEIPESAGGTFWQVTKMEQYRLQFINISNLLWFARQNTGCSKINFAISVLKGNGKCITRLIADADPATLKWEISDKGRNLKFENLSVIVLPETPSKNAIISLTSGNNCSITKRIGDDENLVREMEACNKEFKQTDITQAPVIYPNPSTGVFKILQNGAVLTAGELMVTNSQGVQVGHFKDVKQFNISNLASGIYWYRLTAKGSSFSGKLMKQ